ncbi:hypothetical protein [Sinisalibacter aestuarii]|uniref:Uncharacterized protein n=1 Tax=Sinisalibacter aestuarii TaxID=2949426 RepID=A0ABQ5LS23_9RHOB|nr:hypothetical protein [Sinisalibacter aestuarii]GKY87799.1 hypothetical protein STA1M1_16680 [Sinisalibacter aestuarii]
MTRLALLLALAAAPALAQSADRVAEFLRAVEAAGCVVHEANNQAILAQLGMTPAEGTLIVTLLMSDGRAVPQDDDLRITTGTCS